MTARAVGRGGRGQGLLFITVDSAWDINWVNGHAAVVLWIAAGNMAILLGSDLEETLDPFIVWSPIVA